MKVSLVVMAPAALASRRRSLYSAANGIASLRHIAQLATPSHRGIL